MGKPIFGSSHMKYLKMNNKIAIFPGSFDPITIGHCDIVKRALPLFDEIIIAIGVNNQKKYLFPLEMRLEWIKNAFNDEPKIRVETYVGLTIANLLVQIISFVVFAIPLILNTKKLSLT